MILQHHHSRRETNLGSLLERSEKPNGESILVEEGFHANSSVLGLAFFTFFLFTTLQAFYAMTSNSAALMEDTIAMYVDAATYLCNMFAERCKDNMMKEEQKAIVSAQMKGSDREEQQKDKTRSVFALKKGNRIKSLYLEFFPPLISVFVLLSLTFVGLKESVQSLTNSWSGTGEISTEDEPNKKIMMIFGFIMLTVDVVNMYFFDWVAKKNTEEENIGQEFVNSQESSLLFQKKKLDLSYINHSKKDGDDILTVVDEKIYRSPSSYESMSTSSSPLPSIATTSYSSTHEDDVIMKVKHDHCKECDICHDYLLDNEVIAKETTSNACADNDVQVEKEQATKKGSINLNMYSAWTVSKKK